MGSRVAIGAAFIAGILVGVLFTPVRKHLVREWNQKQYADLVYRCDQAMRSHLISRRTVELKPSASNVTALSSAELALLDCQDYDMLRKKLISWGLNDNDLALMGLRAIEAKKSDLQEVVRIHELRY